MKQYIKAAFMAAVIMLTACSAATESPSREATAESPASAGETSEPSAAESQTTEQKTSGAEIAEAQTGEAQPTQTADSQPEYVKTAADILAEMTIEQKAGQVVLGRYPDENAAEDAESYCLGGYTVFAKDLEDMTAESFSAEISAVQAAQDIPLLIAVDEEGGTIVRVSKFPQYRSENFPSQAEVLEAGGLEGVAEDAAEKASLLKALGINVNLAPVCDLPRSEEDYIADRAYGTEVTEVSAAVAAAVSSYNENGLICALKHFPGYGNNSDTHTGISIDERPLSELRELDFKPFVAGIDSGAPIVMVSHNIVSCINADMPASLSAEMYTLLREELGFSGVIMTDDLSMGAIEEYCGEGSAAVTAFKAGADLLCCTDYKSAVESLIEAVSSGEIAEERLNESVLRILEMKIEYGVITE